MIATCQTIVDLNFSSYVFDIYNYVIVRVNLRLVHVVVIEESHVHPLWEMKSHTAVLCMSVCP